jgi:hydroxypyruvate reductase
MADGTNGSVRQRLSALFETAYKTAHPSVCLPAHLPPVPPGGRIIVIGAGKGSAAMAVAAEEHYIAAGTAEKISGLISTRHGFALPTKIIEILEAGHPVPDENSIDGGRRAIELAKSAGPNDLVLCLLSGGASAIWSAPVEGVSFEAKQALTKQLLKSGAPISEMNRVRKHLSRVKGGKLAAAV